MTDKDERTVAHQAADIVDNVADGIRSAAHTVRETAGRAASAVGETYEGAGKFARNSFKHGRDRIRSWENGFEDSIRDNPKTSMLIAVALGALIGSWWRRK
jgi:hypothetical protein